MFRIALHAPEIPPNTGNVIRLAANTGAELHLVGPLGFSLAERQVRRAGLDYHELADVRVHTDSDAFRAHLDGIAPAPSVWAFTTAADRSYTDVAYAAGDVLLFGRESDGLPDAEADRATARVGLPMVGGSRSLNLANAVGIAVYEAWRQHGFAGGITAGPPARRA
ncbi:tRNA (cytidine(34)-2'-O)-methyltransferase [Pseudonocardia endophytica]|uniref:Putative tRNA (cytidine(34)-2'-O)-methyltransferase n=1 Tax=Pseudonocardia endophytica TaxID=401976 RepID=A0A4R1I5H7_PSEEN|nr:tRNA (cytidine(34)-2'-O)-methyltransferase [Pseudonocardia endophytica]TCK25312.1 tRNA (cytidine/uridine-2'-O-)-methyltransferase [Pseudonocardia endophytica]